MKDNKVDIIDTIVSTLLQVAGRVLEVSYDCVISNCWDRENNGHTLDIIQNEAIVKRYCSVLKDCIKSGESQTAPHNVIIGDIVTSYTIRVLPIHPAKDCLFIAIEFISKKNIGQVAENYWEEALDAAGDGMWDVYVPDERIVFSERWHSIFGYSYNQLNTIQQWIDIIHPDDVESVQKRRLDYFEGKNRYYHSEFRLRCEDGTYKWVLSRGVIVTRAADGSPIRFTGTHTDINDRKIAEERFAATAQMLAKLINNLQEGILVTDENKKLVYANQMFCDIYDIPENPETLIGMEIFKSIEIRKSFYTDPEHFYERTINILNKEEIVLNEEWEMVNGKILSRDFIPLVLGANNKGGIWKFRDITSQKNAEKQLANLRNFYEEILNSIATDIVVFDAQQKYLFINPTAIKDTELRKWMIGRTDEDYCRVRNKSFDLVERRRKVFIKAREEKRNIEWEEVLVNKEGETEYHLRNMFPVFDDKGNHLMGIGYGTNITDRVKAQQELKTSMDTFASAFNDSGTGMALVSPDGKWLDVNNVLCEMTGFSKEGLMRLTFRDITHPDDLDIDLPFVKKILRKEIRTYSVEKRYISRYNKIIQALLTVSLVRDIDDKPKFYIAQVIDITTKKELEWQLRNNNAELQLTKENLLNKINQLEDLSYIIAHNLRGPAGNIKMLAEEAMLTQLGGSSSGDSPITGAFTAEEALCMIHDGSISLLDSLSTLMQITEIKLNKEIPHDECDIAATTNDICNQLQSAIYEKQAIIRRHYDVTTISYPRAYLENILYNLISNALKYTREGIRPEIFITTRMNNGRVQLIVKDNGLGIDTEKYAEKLFKLNGVFHSGFESKGVGLYITKTQVESFGGSIELKSRTNHGCEFTVTL